MANVANHRENGSVFLSVRQKILTVISGKNEISRQKSNRANVSAINVKTSYRLSGKNNSIRGVSADAILLHLTKRSRDRKNRQLGSIARGEIARIAASVTIALSAMIELNALPQMNALRKSVQGKNLRGTKCANKDASA